MRPLEVYERAHCACCGQLVTWDIKVETRGERKLQFCSQNCIEVFDSYVIPTYGLDHIQTLDRSSFAVD